MAVMVRTELTVEAGLVTYRLNLRDPIVTVGGDSSTGKTYLLKYIKSWQGDGKFGDVLVIDDFNHIERMKEDIINSRNKLIIIDYADSILPRIGLTGHDFLVDKNNQYLIFTRNGLEYGASEESLSVFLQEGNIVTIDYLITYGENA